MDFKSLRITCALLLPLLWAEGVWAAKCSQNSYFLDTQAEVDALGATGCDSVAGFLFVASSSDITNLDGLANITSVGGQLEIGNNLALTNLDGLVNITSVGTKLAITRNAALTNLDGLANVTSVGGYLSITSNVALTNLDGLANITSVGGLVIDSNAALTNLDGLAKVRTVPGNLRIYENAALTKLDGLANVTSVGGYLSITSNVALTNLDGLAKLTSVGGNLELYRNDALTNCRGLATVLGWPNGPPDDAVGGILLGPSRNGAGCNSIDEILASVSEPTTPSIISTDSGDGEIILEISISDNGGANITRYDASCTDGPNTYTGTSATSPITVSGLTNGIAYTCKVTATNSVGTSSASAATDPITPEEQVGGLPIWLLYQATQ